MTKKQMPSSSSQSWRRIHHYPLLLLLLLLLLFFLLIRHARAQPANAISAAATAPPPPNPYGFNGNFNPPSLAIIIVIAVSAFFVVGFLTIYIHQCAGGSHLPTTTRRRTLGLNPEIIDSFPTFLYSYVKDLKIGKGALECAVCLSEFEEQETLRWLPKCDHVFHPDCIDAWLSSHSTCPVCRSDLSVAAPTPTTLIPTTTTPISSTNEERNSEQDHDIQFQNQSLNLIEINTLAYETASTAAEEAPTNSRGIPVEKRRVVTGRFPRSHSTGHSAVRPGEDCERFTLRLPEEVRRQLVESTAAAAAAKMKRAKSCVERGEGSVSSRRWWRVGGGGEGSSRFWGTGSDRWVFARAPSFFSRGGSVKSPKTTDGEGSTRGNSKRSFVTSVTAPFDCIGSKAEVEETPANSDRLPV